MVLKTIFDKTREQSKALQSLPLDLYRRVRDTLLLTDGSALCGYLVESAARQAERDSRVNSLDMSDTSWR